MSAPSPHALGAAQLVAWGATFYALPPLLPLISPDLDVSIATLSTAMTAGLLLNALASLAVATWIQRRGARVPMLAGSITASAALAGMAASPDGAVVCAAIAVLGLAHAALLYEPAFAAVATQTDDPIARTRAIQVITFWGGWAALWALPSVTLLGLAVGWRATLLVLAALLAAGTLTVHARLPPPVTRPARHTAPEPPPISIGLGVAFALGAFATAAIAFNGLLMLVDRDVSPTTASIVLALVAPFQVFGRTWFMRRRGRLSRHDGSLPFLLVAASMTALLGAPSWISLALFVVLYGSGTGLQTTIRAAVVILHVAPEHAARQLGIYSLVTSLARALAPAISAWMYARAGFELGLIAFTAMALVAATLVWRATACTCRSLPRSACNSWLTSATPCGARVPVLAP